MPNTMRVCERCGAKRRGLDMAVIMDKRGKRYLCHPGDSTETTCYEWDQRHLHKHWPTVLADFLNRMHVIPKL